MLHSVPDLHALKRTFAAWQIRSVPSAGLNRLQADGVRFICCNAAVRGGCGPTCVGGLKFALRCKCRAIACGR